MVFKVLITSEVLCTRPQNSFVSVTMWSCYRFSLFATATDMVGRRDQIHGHSLCVLFVWRLSLLRLQLATAIRDCNWHGRTTFTTIFCVYCLCGVYSCSDFARQVSRFIFAVSARGIHSRFSYTAATYNAGRQYLIHDHECRAVTTALPKRPLFQAL